MVNGLIWLGVPVFAAVAYFNADRGGLPFGGAIVAVIICAVIAIAGTPKRDFYGVDCRHYSMFASDC